MPVRRKNAIERRIAQLEQDWVSFTEHLQARVLRWIIDADASRMIEAFIEFQQGDEAELPDLFVRIDEPFGDVTTYAARLQKYFLTGYRESCHEYADVTPAPWTGANQVPATSAAQSLVDLLASFQQHYSAIFEHMGVFLLPADSATRSADAWVKWLRELLSANIPAPIRFIVLDPSDTRQLETVQPDVGDRMISIQPELNMPIAYAELARGDTKGIPEAAPGILFRQRFVALTNAAEAGDVATAEQAAQSALQIAQQQNWVQMQTVASMALGAAYFAAGRGREALSVYRQAAQSVQGSDDPTAPMLYVQARFAEGATLIGEAEYADAAQVYETTAPAAARRPEDALLHLECWRMASYCQEMTGEYELAWRHGLTALQLAEKWDPELRRNSTLAYVGQGLIRLARRAQDASREEHVQSRMCKLCGDSWESSLAAETSQS